MLLQQQTVSKHVPPKLQVLIMSRYAMHALLQDIQKARACSRQIAINVATSRRRYAPYKLSSKSVAWLEVGHAKHQTRPSQNIRCIHLTQTTHKMYEFRDINLTQCLFVQNPAAFHVRRRSGAAVATISTYISQLMEAAGVLPNNSQYTNQP